MAIQECLRQNFGRVELVEDVFVLLRDRIETNMRVLASMVRDDSAFNIWSNV